MGWLPGVWWNVGFLGVGSWFIRDAAEDVAQRQSQNSSTGEQITCYSSGMDFQAETAPALSRKARSNPFWRSQVFELRLFAPLPKPILWRPTLLPCSTPDPPGLVVARPNRLILPRALAPPPLTYSLPFPISYPFRGRCKIRDIPRIIPLTLHEHCSGTASPTARSTLITNAFPSFSAPSAPSNIWYRSQFRVIT